MATNINRRAFVSGGLALGAVAAMGGVAGCSSSSSDSGSSSTTTESANAVDHTAIDESQVGSDDYTIRLAMTKGNPNPVAVINALQEGFFEEEKANVDLTIVEDMATAYSSVATDDMDMVVAMNLALNRIAEGESNLYMAGGIMSSGGVLEVAPDSDIKLEKPEDFKGLTLCGIQADSETVVIEAWLIENGLVRDEDYKMIYSESMSVNVENVLKGTADVAILNGVPVYMVGIKQGLKVAAYNQDLVGMYPCCRVTVNKAMVTDHKIALTQFLLGELRGYKMFKEDQKGTVKNLADFTGVDEESLEAVYYGTEDFRTAMVIVMDPQVDLIKDYYEDYKTDGFIDKDTPYSTDDFYYNEAYVAALEIMAEREPDEELWQDMKKEYDEYNTTYNV